MILYLKAGGMLREYLQPDVDAFTRRVECTEGMSLRDILLSIGIRPVHVAMAFSGDRLIPLSHVPSDGETITLRPPVQGG